MLVQAFEDMWAISPDPRRDRLTVGFVICGRPLQRKRIS